MLCESPDLVISLNRALGVAHHTITDSVSHSRREPPAAESETREVDSTRQQSSPIAARLSRRYRARESPPPLPPRPALVRFCGF